jgi:CheY-like chemotaxis protein
MRTAASRTIDTLLVEDNRADIRLTQEAMAEADVKGTLHVVRDGNEAMDFLRHRGAYGSAPRPDLILLDLNLPGLDGREVLAQIKSDPQLRQIPVVVLTTSSDAYDVARTYDLQVNCFITKPVDLDHFLKVIGAIKEFWIDTVTLPDYECVT